MTNSNSYSSKARGLFLNPAEAQCSIYESGRMSYDCLRLSDRYQLDYQEIDPTCTQIGVYDFYVFNYHHVTMAWLNTDSIRKLPGKKFTLVLETLPGDPFVLCPVDVFDAYLTLDPTMDRPGDPRVYAFPRPLESPPFLPPFREPDIPIIGTFGFATPGKGFERVVDAVNREFERAIVRINIPSSTYADNATYGLHRTNYASYLSDLCRRVANPGIHIQITNDYLSKKQLISWCAGNSLNCFLYHRDQPGLAATTDQAIVSGRPLSVSANETFRHIHAYLKPYPFQSLRQSLDNSEQSVLKMKHDWAPQAFSRKFEKVLADFSLLPSRGKIGYDPQRVDGYFPQKEKVLVVSHKETQCGIHQYGVNIVGSLCKSSQYTFEHVLCSSPEELHHAILTTVPAVVIYNYYPGTMPWLTPIITRSYPVPCLGVMHEVTQEEADHASTEMFDFHLCPDPTLVQRNPCIIPTKRLIPHFLSMRPEPPIPVFGSFGFGFGNKGFHDLVVRIQEEYDQAIIRLHMPFNGIVDTQGNDHALATARHCQLAIRKRGIRLEINHTFLKQKKLLEFLADNTINCFFYDRDRTRGISSVIEHALAVERPIAITRSAMFRHVLTAKPSICIEDNSLHQIIANGIAPLVPFYNEWSEANFIKDFERILENVLRRGLPATYKTVRHLFDQDDPLDRIPREKMNVGGAGESDSNNRVTCQDSTMKTSAGVLNALQTEQICTNEKTSRQEMRNISNVQIELAGRCSAECEFCDWVRRPKEQMIFMDTELAKKCVREARSLGAKQISFHITGESLLHPDILDILPRDYPILVSTNCLQLEGSLARELSNMENLTIILAVLWSESEKKRITSIVNAAAFLQMNPRNRLIILQMICSEHSVSWASFMYNYFSPYLDKLPRFQLHLKQPYTQEPERPTLGYIPENIPEGERVQIDRMPTPQSCGPDCVAFSPNPSTDILVQSDGQIKPCFKRWPHWNLGYAQNTSLRDAWTSKRFAKIRSIWSKGDPDNQLACYDCIRMAVPRGEPVWWGPGGAGMPPSSLDFEQSLRSNDPNPYPKL